ncbi:MAG: exosome complex RNA-binding protein Csl4 [Candidatus Altiarchaeota archaeon]
MTGKKTMIGDYLGTIEEFVPGEGTYSEDGKIYASKVGELTLDKENHTVTVNGRELPDVRVGQIVFGDVTGFRKNMVTLNVSKIEGIENEIDVKTNIYVSNISDGYVEQVEDMFGIGDIVKGKVIKLDRNMIDISTKGDYGVVKAFCKRCRLPLIKSEKKETNMECSSCGHKENRKIAKDYGNVKVT